MEEQLSTWSDQKIMLLNRLAHETNFIPNSNFLYPISFHSSNSFTQFDYIILQIMYKTSSSTDRVIDSSTI